MSRDRLRHGVSLTCHPADIGSASVMGNSVRPLWTQIISS
jgi:hypothetical protein